MSTRLNSPDSEGVLHYVTLNVRDRKAAFRRPEYAELVLRELRFECDRHPAALVAFVVMPDHIHFLFGPEDGQVKRFLARFKPGVTLKLDALAAHNGREKERAWLAEKGKRELWQDSKHSLPIYSPGWIREKIEYIHNNPVKSGLVENTGDFPFSSFRNYYPESGAVPLVKVDFVEF
jgi:putative transposase